MKKASYHRVQLCLVLALGMFLQSFLSFSFRQSTKLQQELQTIDVSSNHPSVKCSDDKSEALGTASAKIEGSSSCQDEMIKILRRQQCFQLQESSASTTITNNNIQAVSGCDSSPSVRQMPFHNYAAYAGQGFGRIVEHTVLGCIFASVLLERPCTIDLDVRDPYWTWRSFLNHGGAFDWEWNGLQNGKDGLGGQVRLEIDQAMAKLGPSRSDDMWDTKYFDGNDDQTKNQSFVLPMIWNEGWSLEQHLEYWAHATATSPYGRQQRLLLSPNWGNAWNQHVPVPSLIAKKTNGQCKFNHLRSLLQNAMFAPTSLSRLLHQQRVDRMFPSSSQTTWNSPPAQPVYGAIHLRTVLSDVNVRRSYLTPEWVQALGKCLDKALSLPSSSGISHWWLIADNRTVATYVLQSLPKFHAQVPAIVDMNPHMWEKDGTHSGYAMKQKYFHTKMESSMMDFMVLHESHVAVVSHGSFGSTGARGNGKVKITACAPQKSFSIFAAPKQ